MDAAKFQAIFSKETYRLPIRWDGKDFYATLYNHLKKYRKDIENYPNLLADVKTVCHGICAAVDLSLKGYPEKAYKRFKNVMEFLNKDPLLIDTEEINKENLYRVVDVGNAAVPNRQRIFHVPFSMRSKMSTQRYSIPGFPCLYLGTSVELCCMELGKDPKYDYACVSRYELQTGTRRFNHFLGDQSPPFDNDRFTIFDVSIKPDQAIEILQHDDSRDNAEFINKYIRWYPLISACSYIRAMRDDPYSAEYIIPQLFLQWVRSEDEDAVVGIKYFSCISIHASTLGDNYVFPTMGIPFQARKTITNYCARLSHRFKLTNPEFIMNHVDIPACVEVINKDNDLQYIEDYNTGENEKIEGDYEIPDGVSAIGAFTFSKCRLLTSISIPDSVTSIGGSAFDGCSSLKNISIPDSVTSIGASAFYGCSSLISISIPDNVTSIGDRAFSGCSSLVNIIVNNTNESYMSVDDVLYSKDMTKLICYPAGKNQTSISIPDSVTSIGAFAFFDCSSLTSIVIPDSVTSIGDDAFSGCSSLSSISIPDGVTSIGNYAFSDCSSLTSISIPDGVTSIGNYAFSDCSSLTSIIIPDNVTSIGAFAFYDCSSLTSISIPDGVTSIGNYAFSDCSSLTSISIPDGVTSIGNYAFSDCSSLTSISIPDGVTSIGNYAFYDCSSLTSIIIPDNVTSIGDSAFYDCSSLTSISIPDGVTSIGNYAFSGCSSLSSISIPDGVTSIGSSAFSYCNLLKRITVNNSNKAYKSKDGVLYSQDMTKLICYPAGKNQTSISIPVSVTSIGAYAFSGYSSLISVNIPDSVKSIGDSAFSDCSSLSSIDIPDGVTSIGDSAFYGCRSLTSISIPDSVTGIGAYSFYGCRSLTSISIPNCVTGIGAYSFYGCGSLTSISILVSVTSIGNRAFFECSALKTVFYSGTREQAESIIIGWDNECLENAIWVYGSSGSES